MNQVEVRETYGKFVSHLRANKNVYIASAAGVAAGTVGTLLIGSPQKVKASQKALGWHVTQNLQQTTILTRRGHPGNVIRCNETGELFASQKRAATVMGVDAGAIGKHLSGKNAHVKGHTFTKLGEAQPA